MVSGRLEEVSLHLSFIISPDKIEPLHLSVDF